MRDSKDAELAAWMMLRDRVSDAIRMLQTPQLSCRDNATRHALMLCKLQLLELRMEVSDVIEGIKADREISKGGT